ncbi:uncharacterized protein LOC141715063 [Apium graveolens]|uniref:uncharacterized protein LOC141715063 n=1 Tax=Apium graveolens TaxID=4045 RepID=UPI003D7B6F8A
MDYWRNIPASHLLPKLISVSSFMARWGRTFFHKFRDKVKNQKEIINAWVNRSDEEGVKRYFEETKKLDELLYHEKLHCKQRAKTSWLTEGDTNSKFFHAATSKRKKLNHIAQLISTEGEVVDNHDDMCKITAEYFKKIFAEGDSGFMLKRKKLMSES